MTLWKNSAPAYAVPYMEQGTFVRTFNDNICYLYKKTSQRVPGKKYPVPYEKYLGKITPDKGFIPCTRRNLELSGIQVQECGWSMSILAITPDSWKKAAGKQWESILHAVIVHSSPTSFLKTATERDISEELSVQIKTQTLSLWRRLREEKEINYTDLIPLKQIYLLTFKNGTKALSAISEEHQIILDKYHITLEVR
jgi:hypothetical protein